MADALARTRCLNHAGREAAARCPSCRRHFCRECVVEHHGRLLCASCLTAAGEAQPLRRRRLLRSCLRVVGTALGFLLVWFLFFAAGDLLSRLPESYHATSEAQR